MVVNLVKEETHFPLNACCHITFYVQDQFISTIFQVEVGVETGVVLIDRHSLFRALFEHGCYHMQ